jgi:phage gpG-like protein
VFTDNPYAAIHQFGLVNEDGVQMSPRPFFPIDGTQESFVLNEYAEHEIRLAAEMAIAELLAK